MNFAHTPGPWVGQDTNGRFNSNHNWSTENTVMPSSEYAPIWAGGKVIALVVSSSNLYSPSSEGLLANAKLIAAVPKLLEACIVLQFEAAARGCGLRIADEAIAEAIGGSE